jgi:hypothetical protein
MVFEPDASLHEKVEEHCPVNMTNERTILIVEIIENASKNR